MTPEEIAEKYVHGKHDAFTDNQEKIDMVSDINQAIRSKLEEAKVKIEKQKSHVSEEKGKVIHQAMHWCLQEIDEIINNL